MTKVAPMLRSHKNLLLNEFRDKWEVSCGTGEGLNNKQFVLFGFALSNSHAFPDSFACRQVTDFLHFLRN
jgi:hypothetical protein